jgi:choline-glycine betaine transporter
VTEPATDPTAGQSMADVLKSWVMVVLTLIFVILYAAALLGKLKPLSDVSMVTRLEPIIFVIIGYYFGRLPAQQNEKTLKDEIGRQTQKADAAQHAKEQAQQTREAAEEKMKNVSAALTSSAPATSVARFDEDIHTRGGPINEDGLRYSVGAALRILNS